MPRAELKDFRRIFYSRVNKFSWEDTILSELANSEGQNVMGGVQGSNGQFAPIPADERYTPYSQFGTKFNEYHVPYRNDQDKSQIATHYNEYGYTSDASDHSLPVSDFTITL